MNKIWIVLIVISHCAFAEQPAAAPVNLLRNGSFEGSTRYWYGWDDQKNKLMHDNAPFGSTYLHINKEYLYSGSFCIAPASTVTVGATVRSAGEKSHIYIYLVPNSPRIGKEPFKVFWGKSGFGSDVTSKDWKRQSWTVTVPGADWWKEGWWDNQGWMIFLCGDNLDVDGVAVTLGTAAKEKYVPYSPIEVATVAQIPGDKLKHWNLLDAGQTIPMITLIHNPGDKPAPVRWSHQILDYTGVKAFATVAGAESVLAPGETREVAWQAPLAGKGLQLARSIVTDTSGKELGRSDQPLTVLAFPKSTERTPDQAERFGYSLCDVGPPPWTQIYDALARIGFSWSRWHPQLAWSGIQPDAADQWKWPDAVLDELQKRGCSYNVTLNGIPGWAKGKLAMLPKDMEAWNAKDPRWDDLTTLTSWDRFVKAAVERYGNGKRSVIWEIVNEPTFEKWDPDIYTRFIVRTSRLIKSVDPKAQVMIDGVYGLDWISHAVIDRGGAKHLDLFSFHQYGGSGWYTSSEQVSGIHEAFKAAGHDVGVWMNEGWTCWPSSDDTPAWSVFSGRSPIQVVHESVACTADAIAGGMDKVIMFNTAHHNPGRSWWDWGGDGQCIWDDNGQPTVAVGAFNVLADQLSLAKWVGTVRSKNAVIHVFQDERNKRGVAVAWGTDARVEFQFKAANLVRMDVMGNTEPLAPRDGIATLALTDVNRPWYIYDQSLSGAQLLALFKPFEKPNVVLAPGVYGLPEDWAAKGKEGNPYLFNGKPIWRVGRVWPPDLTKAECFYDFPEWVPDSHGWFENAHSQGGHPIAVVGTVKSISTSAPWQGGDGTKPSTISFVAPHAGKFEMSATLREDRWTGNGATWIVFAALDRAGKKVRTVQPRKEIQNQTDTPVSAQAQLAANEELVLIFGVDAMYTAAACQLNHFTVREIVGDADINAPKK